MHDFGAKEQTAGVTGRAAGMEKREQGHKREWLQVFETLPPQMLNAYGPAKFAKMSDESVWQSSLSMT